MKKRRTVLPILFFLGAIPTGLHLAGMAAAALSVPSPAGALALLITLTIVSLTAALLFADSREEKETDFMAFEKDPFGPFF